MGTAAFLKGVAKVWWHGWATLSLCLLFVGVGAFVLGLLWAAIPALMIWLRGDNIERRAYPEYVANLRRKYGLDP
jgi:hypothetical protein